MANMSSISCATTCGRRWSVSARKGSRAAPSATRDGACYPQYVFQAAAISGFMSRITQQLIAEPLSVRLLRLRGKHKAYVNGTTSVRPKRSGRRGDYEEAAPIGDPQPLHSNDFAIGDSMSTGGMTRGALIAALNRAMRDASGQGVLYSQVVAERVGINSTDLECLDFIVLRGPISAGELAAATGLTTGAITGVIDRLERAGLARRNRHGSHRRKALGRALPAVERRIGPLFQPLERGAMSVVSQCGDKDVALLLDGLSRLGEAAATAIIELDARPKSTAKPRSRK